MNLYVIKKIESALLNILISAFLIVLLFFAVKQTYNDYVMVNNNEYVMATIKSVTHRKKSNYYVEISYEKDSEIHTGDFLVHKKLSDSFGNYFNKKYAVGQKIPVIIGKGHDVIPYAERNNTVIRDIVSSVLLIAVLMFLLWAMLKHSDETEEYDFKECLCSLFHIMAYLCFISIAFFIFVKKYTVGFFFLACGFILVTLPEIFIKREVHIKSNKVTFQENPGLFIFGCIVYFFITAMLIYANLELAK